MITPGIIPTKAELQEEVDRLRADNAALRADKERLVNAGTLLAQIAKHASNVTVWREPNGCERIHTALTAWRAAIDAARKEQP